MLIARRVLCQGEGYVGIAKLSCSRARRTLSTSTNAGDDPWSVLGIQKGCTNDEIKKAYRKLAKKWHPDLHNTTTENYTAAEKEFKKIHSAYAILTGRERTVSSFTWAQRNADDEAARQAPTNSQVAMYLCALGGASVVFAFLWRTSDSAAVRNRVVDDRAKLASLYSAQTAQWQEELSDKEVQKMIEKRKAVAIQHAIQQGTVGAFMYGSIAVASSAALKLAETRPTVQKLMIQQPFLAFFTRLPVLAFFISSSTALGFYFQGVRAITPTGQLNRVKHQGIEQGKM